MARTWRELGSTTRAVAIWALAACMATPAFGVFNTPGIASVDQAGNAAYSVAIVPVPGTAGMVPAISLNYNSASSNGPIGVGGQLGGLSAIARCPATIATENIVGGVQLNSADRFCLDGQKLVVIGTGTYGANGTEYRTESESFTKVISYGNAGGGPAWFQVWTKSGLIKEYGNTTDSRMLPPGSAVALTWAVNKVSDRSGNYYQVAYDQDAVTGNFGVSRVDYTGNGGAGGTLPFASIRFEYDARPDVESGYVASYRVQATKRLAHVKTYLGEQLVRDYRLTYGISPSTGRSRLTSLTECAGDGTCLNPTSVTWKDGGGGASGPSAPAVAVGTPGNYIIKTIAGDFNGDGIQDLFIVKQGVPSQICLGPQLTGTPSCSDFTLWTGSVADVGDVDGDGRSDIIVRSSDGHVVVCFGPTFTSEDVCPVLFAPYNVTVPGYQLEVGDFTGDGRTDAYLWSPDYAMYCDLSAILANPNLQCAGSSPNAGVGGKAIPGRFVGDGRSSVRLLSSTWVSSYSTVVGDFNGDGKSDLMRASSSGLQFCPGPGIQSADNCQAVAGATGDWKSTWQLVAGDFNGDGTTDLILAGAAGTYFCAGPGIASSANCIQINTNNWRNAILVSGDFNGDSSADLHAISAGQGWLTAGGAGAPDLALSVTDGLGAVSTFQYKTLSDTSVYTKGTGAVYPNLDLDSPTPVVSRACRSDGIGGSACMDYLYSGARMGLTGRGFLGFNQIRSTDAQAGRYTVSTFNQTFPLIGFPASVYTYVGSQAIKKLDYAFAQKPSFESRQFPALVSVTEYNNGLDGEWKSHLKTYFYDGYGNHSQESTNINYLPRQLLNLATFSYNIDATNWLLGRVATKSVQSYFYLQPAVNRRTDYTYAPGSILPNQTIVEPLNSALRQQIDITRDVFGNVVSQTVSAQGILNRVSTWTYDAQGRFAVSNTNPMGHVVASTFDSRFGGRTAFTDPNGLTTTTTFDSFGRQIAETRPDGTQSTTSYVQCPACAALASNGVLAYYVSNLVSGNSQPSIKYFDVLGRQIASSTRNFADTDWRDEEVISFDSSGRKIRTYLPHFRADATKPYSTIAYDTRGRVATVTAPDLGVTTYSYSEPPTGGPITTTVVDARNFSTQTSRTWLGQVVQVVDANAKTTTFEYAPDGQLAKVVDPLGNQATRSYDAYGHLIAKSDPDLGNWTYTYDPVGQQISQTDAKGQVTTFAYDRLGRQVQRTEPSITATWTWDTATMGVGKIASSATNSGVNRTYLYDAVGRPVTQSVTVDGNTYAASLGFDVFGRPETLTYPTGYAVRNVYNTVGYLAEVRNAGTSALIWRAVAQSAAGITDEDLGNGTGIVRTFDPNTQRVSQIGTIKDSDGAILQNFVYAYDLSGNVTSRAETTQGLSETFAFDALNRLKSVTGPASKTYSYNDIGNIVSKSDVGSYSYPNTGQVHAVTAAGGVSYTYDLNGNMIAAGGKTLSWTSFNMPATVQSGGNSYSWQYDADFGRVKYTTPSDTTIYVAASQRLLLEKVTNGGSASQRHYIYANGKIVAQFTQHSDGTNDMRYYYRDHLGSTTLILDESGNVAERLSYDAQGKRRFASGADDTGGSLAGVTSNRGFTSHEHLDSLGFIHMNGRIYDPRIGRFASADPTVPYADDPQSWNRFSYVRNDPLGYVDPSGFGDCNATGRCPNVHSQNTPTGTAGAAVDGASSDGVQDFTYDCGESCLGVGARRSPDSDFSERWQEISWNFRNSGSTSSQSPGGGGANGRVRVRTDRDRPGPRPITPGSFRTSPAEREQCYSSCVEGERDLLMDYYFVPAIVVSAIGTIAGTVTLGPPGAAIGAGLGWYVGGSPGIGLMIGAARRCATDCGVPK